MVVQHWMHLVLLSYLLKDGWDDEFYVQFTTINKH